MYRQIQFIKFVLDDARTRNTPVCRKLELIKTNFHPRQKFK